MNVICVVIAIGVVTTSAAADVAANRTKFENFMYRRCNQYSSDLVAYDNIKQHFDQFTDYFRLAFSKLPHETNDFCSNEKPRLSDLMKSLVNDIRPCLPKDEKYLPKFLYDSFNHFMSFLCADNAKNINNFFSTAGGDCLSKLKQQAAGNEIRHCFTKIVPPFDSVVKKDSLCDDLDTAKKCFSTAITKHCPEAPAFLSLNTRLFRAIREPCNASTWVSGISSLVLLASILVHKIVA